ncbi:hypothetical protein BVY03_05185 [bacterium K02(2017)]|nr:hypothetical protein BVY03_05185 [bacterium K02(2017)]
MPKKNMPDSICFMTEWRIKGDESLKNLYKDLQKIANIIADGDTTKINTPQPNQDTFLSQDDMTIWLQGQENPQEARKKLFFTDANTGIKHTKFSKLSRLFDALIKADMKDHKLNHQFTLANNHLILSETPKTMEDLVYEKLEGVLLIDVKNKEQNKTQGTGWVYKREQLTDNTYRYWVISNAHVIDSKAHIETSYTLINAKSKKNYNATLVGGDHSYDVGVLYFDTNDLIEPMTINLDKMKTGDHIAIIGNQLGLGATFTKGQINDNNDFTSSARVPVYQHDADATSGNSGSPSFDKKGNVIGMVVSQIKARAQIGHIIPIKAVLKSYNSIVNEYRSTGNLGTHKTGSILKAKYHQLERDTLERLGIEYDNALYVTHIISGSAADQSGLKPGDIIVGYDNKPIPQESSRMQFDLTTYPIGSHIPLSIVKSANSKQIHTLSLKIEESSDPISNDLWKHPIGLAAIPLTPEKIKTLEALGINSPTGVILGNTSETPIIPPGLTVSAINNIPTPDLKTFSTIFEKLIEENKPISLHGIWTNNLKNDNFYRLRLLVKGNQIESLIIEDDDKDKIPAHFNLGFLGARLNQKQKSNLGIPDNKEGIYVQIDFNDFTDLDNEALRPGDVVVGFNNKNLNEELPWHSCFENSWFNWIKLCSVDGLLGYSLHEAYQNKMISLQIYRDGKQLTINRKINSPLNTSNNITAPENNSHYFDATILNKKERKILGIGPFETGVYIRLPDTQKKHPYGLSTGMLVTHINGTEINHPEDLKLEIERLKEQEQPILLEVGGTNKWKVPGHRQLIEILEHVE